MNSKSCISCALILTLIALNTRAQSVIGGILGGLGGSIPPPPDVFDNKINKQGTCQSPASLTNCENTCRSSNDCSHEELCCPSASGVCHVCSKPALTACQVVNLNSQLLPPIGSYQPQCTDSGEYQQIQFHGSTGYSWCVDTQGNEIPFTRTPPGRGRPRCDSDSAPCDEIGQCDPCEHGYETNEDGCPTCECKPHPCKNSGCPPESECILEDALCISDLCPKLIKCVETEAKKPSCLDIKCDAGTECRLQQVLCFRAPCDPVPECVPIDEPKELTCEDIECRPFEVCALQEVICKMAPCRPPVPTCIPLPPDDLCAEFACPRDQVCALKDDVCKKEHCDPVPTCIGVGTINPNLPSHCTPRICRLFCEGGRAKDENNCDTCECLETRQEVDTVKEPRCEPVECRNFCLMGRAKDENGCETCKCVSLTEVMTSVLEDEESGCPPLFCRLQCDYGLARKEGCFTCSCSEDKTRQGCPIFKCVVGPNSGNCDNYEYDANGCRTCSCAKSDIEGFSLDTGICSAINCNLECRNGLAEKRDGCFFCSCSEDNTRRDCPSFRCRVRNNRAGCATYKYDENGCRLCECEDSDVADCPIVSCSLQCEYGLAVSNGCFECTCSNDRQQRCPDQTCTQNTESCTSFIYDRDGCRTCQCSSRSTGNEPETNVPVCEQPQQTNTGAFSCLAYIPRWWYDKDTQECQRFIYGGCGGTQNNFETYEACRQQCAPRQGDYCDQPLNTGLCGEYSIRWFHNSATGKCERFVYTGCGGNDNNFVSFLDCITRCNADVDDKPGVCPDLSRLMGDECLGLRKCDTDADCKGIEKCCTAEGCGVNLCWIPDELSACQIERASNAQKDTRFQDVPTPLEDSTPFCDAESNYEQIQCDPYDGTCYCVDSSGAQFINTRVQGQKPVCPDTSHCDRSCNLDCNYGHIFEIDEDTQCPVCKCQSNPCRVTLCPRNQFCHTLKLQCNGQYCPGYTFCDENEEPQAFAADSQDSEPDTVLGGPPDELICPDLTNFFFCILDALPTPIKDLACDTNQDCTDGKFCCEVSSCEISKTCVDPIKKSEAPPRFNPCKSGQPASDPNNPDKNRPCSRGFGGRPGLPCPENYVCFDNIADAPAVCCPVEHPPEPKFNPCYEGKPATDPDNPSIELTCAPRLFNKPAILCPDGYECFTAIADRKAVCCPIVDTTTEPTTESTTELPGIDADACYDGYTPMEDPNMPDTPLLCNLVVGFNPCPGGECQGPSRANAGTNRGTCCQQKQQTIRNAHPARCLLPKKVGRCRGAFRRYYYNEESKSCEEFIYGGCQGNGNNFKSIQACEEKCVVSKTVNSPPACRCTLDNNPVCGNDFKTYSNLCELLCVQQQQPQLLKMSDGPCTTINEPSCKCTRQREPVCGSDGITYHNPCFLRCMEKNDPQLAQISAGECPVQDFAIEPCACSRELNQVCGNDDTTYNNPCLLTCAQFSNPQLRKLKDGPCESDTESKLCFCTRELNEVCGSDGLTYNNPCLLSCAQKDKPELEQVHRGACPTGGSRDRCFCTRILDPVCGSDGETYNNPCLLGCAQRKNPQLTKASSGPCGTGLAACSCTREYDPVCGSDGKTYSNLCNLECAQKDNPHLTRLYSGECESRSICICTADYRPVCGSDGKTYSNQCRLECAQKSNPQLVKRHDGECGRQSPCVCTADYTPVCGSDGKTYGNQCGLECAQKDNPRLTKLYEGECGKQSSCVCTADYNPVCGSDGETYGNQCGLECAQKDNPELTKLYNGECRKPSPCICTADYTPVCGSDGKTYGNQCGLECAQRDNPHLIKRYDGECGSQSVCPCTTDYTPVCGTDGKTYDNQCRLRCAQKNDQNLRKLTDGECDKLCRCTEDYTPVCGNDGITYSNLCELQCAQASNPDIQKVSDGECSSKSIVCHCNRAYRPVCGTDKKTYGNICKLQCAQRQDPTLSMDREGECPTEPPTCFCPTVLDPVCGSDGQTYDNKCHLDCAKLSNPKLNVEHSGQCQEGANLAVRLVCPNLSGLRSCPFPAVCNDPSHCTIQGQGCCPGPSVCFGRKLCVDLVPKKGSDVVVGGGNRMTPFVIEGQCPDLSTLEACPNRQEVVCNDNSHCERFGDNQQCCWTGRAGCEYICVEVPSQSKKQMDDTLFIPAHCKMPIKKGPCGDKVTRWFFNTTSYHCEKFVYGGCGGNANNFKTQDACTERCSNTTQNEPRFLFCLNMPDYGKCYGKWERWFYDSHTRECKRFEYSGCGGNGNNFLSKGDCASTCLSQ